MRKTALLAAVVMMSATGCPQKDEEGSAEEARDAIPGAEYMKVDVPVSAHNKVPAVGQVAPSYLLTVGTATVLNGGAAFVLIMVKTIVSFPVTSKQGGTYIWGPWTDSGLKPGEYRLTAKMNGNGDYEWNLQGRKKAEGASAAFKTIISGVATPGRPNRGSGSFTIDFDAARTIDPFPADETGQISVTYDLESAPIDVTMDAEHGADTLHYAYQQAADGSGQLLFTVHADTDDVGTQSETSTIRSRWRATGTGRADITITGGDLGALTATASECWSTSFLRTYAVATVAWMASEGDAASCAF